MSRLHSTCLLTPCEKDFFCGNKYINSSSFSDMEWQFSVFCQNFSRQVCQSCILLVHRNILGKNSFFKILMFSDQLRTMSKNVAAFCGKSLGRFVKMTFYMSIGTLWGEECFWRILMNFFVIFEFWAIFLCFSSILLQQECQNGVVRVKR